MGRGAVGEATTKGDTGMSSMSRITASLMLALGALSGCSTAPASPDGRERLIERGATALREWNAEVTGIEAFARQSHGYAIFPGVGKGGLGVGLAYGRGVVYAQGRHIGYADVAQASVGLQAGGQAYRLLVVFDDAAAVERFKRGRLDVAPSTSAVLVAGGYVIETRFIDGVSVIARPIGGLMGEVALGGERFTFAPRDDGPAASPSGVR